MRVAKLGHFVVNGFGAAARFHGFEQYRLELGARALRFGETEKPFLVVAHEYS